MEGEQEQQTEVATEQAEQSAEQTQEGQEKEGEQRVSEKAENRWAKLSRENQELRTQIEATRAEMAQFGKPTQEYAEAQRRKEEARKFYQDPFAYIEKVRYETQAQSEARIKDERDQGEYQALIRELKGAPGWSNELNDAIVEAIRENELNDKDEFGRFRIQRAKALKMAYQAATGKKWGDWNKDAYNTRVTKERLMRPGSRGGGSASGGTMTPEEFDALPIEEYDKNVEKYNRMLAAYHAQQR